MFFICFGGAVRMIFKDVPTDSGYRGCRKETLKERKEFGQDVADEGGGESSQWTR
jgi:hypothetical protein